MCKTVGSIRLNRRCPWLVVLLGSLERGALLVGGGRLLRVGWGVLVIVKVSSWCKAGRIWLLLGILTLLLLLSHLTLRREDRVWKGRGGGWVCAVVESRTIGIEVQKEPILVVVRHLEDAGV